MCVNIMVADDEKSIADLIEVYLQNEDFKIFKCYTGTVSYTHLVVTPLFPYLITVLFLLSTTIYSPSNKVILTSYKCSSTQMEGSLQDPYIIILKSQEE